MAALVSPFSLADVSAEFGTNTRPSTKSLRNFIGIIKKSAATTGDRLSYFAGTGRPTGTTSAGSSNCSGGSFQPVFKGNISFLGGTYTGGTALTCQYRFKYSTDPLYTSPAASYTSWTTAGATGNVSQSPAGYSYSNGQTVYYQIQIRNEYCNATGDEATVQGSQLSITFTKPTLVTPDISTGSKLVEDVGFSAYISFTYVGAETSFLWEYKINAGSWKTVSQDCNVNVGTGNSAIQIAGTLQDAPSQGFQTVYFRIRANGDACNNNSATSAQATATYGSPPTCPL